MIENNEKQYSNQHALIRYGFVFKELVQNNQGKTIRMEDFNAAINGQTAPVYVRELLTLGVLLRHKVETGRPGHNYSYTWDDSKEQVMFTRVKINPREKLVLTIDNYLRMWEEKQEGTDETILAIKMLGAKQFTTWLKEELAK